MRRIAPARTASPITLGDRLQLLFHQELAEESGRITCYQWVMSFPGEPQEPSFLHLREKMSIHVKKWPVFVVFASGSYGGRPAEGSELHNPKVERRQSAGLSAKPQTQVPSFLRASGQKGGATPGSLTLSKASPRTLDWVKPASLLANPPSRGVYSWARLLLQRVTPTSFFVFSVNFVVNPSLFFASSLLSVSALRRFTQ